MSGLRRLAAALMAVLFLSQGAPLASASVRAITDEELARASAAAVQGRVVAAVSQWDAAADAIYTYVTLDLTASWGLAGAPTRVVVKQLGGVVGATALVIGGQARFAVGEEVVLFLDVRPRDGTLSVAGLEQGKWTLTESNEPAAAFAREVWGTGRDPVVRDYRDVAALHHLAALTGTRVRATGAVLEPNADAAAPAAGGPDSPFFTLLSPSNPARWYQADSGTPVYVDSQSGGHPQFAGGGLTQLARAAATWTGAGSLNLMPGAQRGPRCFSNSEVDGRISVTYGDPCGEIADDSSTLAIGGAYFSYGTAVVNGVQFWRITKGMVITDNVPSKYSWMTTGCYEDMLAHEIGHAIGFGHSAASGAVMYPSIPSNCGSRTLGLPLQPDDRAGMAAVYPGSSPVPTPPGAPTGLTASVSGSTVTISWTPPTTGSAPAGYQLTAGSAPGAANYGAINTAAPSLVVPGVPNGVYYVRVVAGNAQGISPPTADLTITVGPALPGAPRNLTASAGPGGSVAVSWLPPASGGTPTSYLLVAGLTPGASTYVIPVSGTSLAGGGVAAATYYLRVVAVNATGVGAASGQITLVVP